MPERKCGNDLCKGPPYCLLREYLNSVDNQEIVDAFHTLAAKCACIDEFPDLSEQIAPDVQDSIASPHK